MLTKKQVDEIREHLEKAQNPLFLFDNDNDGLCSFLLLQRYIGRGKGFPVKTAPELTKDYFRKVTELESDYIFILDQPEVSQEFVDEVEKVNIPIVWIDHHEIDKKKVPEYLSYYNPFFNKPKSNEPVTALCYQIANKKEDMWIGIIGSISDKFIPDFYPEFKKQFPEMTVDAKDAFDIYFNSKIGELAQMFGFAMKDRTTNVINMMKFLMKAKGPYDVLEENSRTSGIHKRFSELYKTYQKLLRKARKEAENSGKVVFFKYSSENGMSAELANRIKYLFPDKIVAIARLKEGNASISFRGAKIRDKVLEIIKDLDRATGGGHETAAGAQIRLEDVDVFEKKLKEMIE